MFAIVSLLDAFATDRVHTIWDALEESCGLKGIQLTPYPHFSWQIAESYPEAELRPVLEGIARETKPFYVYTSGVGIFTGVRPVVYLSLVKDDTLLSLHSLLWDKAGPFAADLNFNYAPEAWEPHITLARSDVTYENLHCALGELSTQKYQWEIHIDHIALVSQTGDEIGGIIRHFPFGG
jgi:2'-5' RNA ligase